MIKELQQFVRDIYQTNEFIPLHYPTFNNREKDLVGDVIDSTFVSSVGKYVDQFEILVQDYTQAQVAVAVVNGTAALHTALYSVGVRQNDVVIAQALTFVATCNVIHHLGATPIFVDVNETSLGLCPRSLSEYLISNAERANDGTCVLKSSGQCIRAVVPMHTFGHPVELDELVQVCSHWGLALVEDAAESLGSFYKGQHTGTFGQASALSFNGNKIITTGGGGMVLCSKLALGKKVKHITTTAKVPHEFEFYHDEVGFNFRMPNINAALGCAQMEKLSSFILDKRRLAKMYEKFFSGTEYTFIQEPDYASSNYWLNAVLCPDQESRNTLLKEVNANGIMIRPVWKLMTELPMFSHVPKGDLTVSYRLEQRLVNLPSTPPTD